MVKRDHDFVTALDLLREEKRRKKEGKYGFKHVVLLDCGNWLIETDYSFPSTNYIIRKKKDRKYKQAAYCVSLEDALKTIFDAMLLENVKGRKDYGAGFQDLRNLILETKTQFKALLDVNPLIKAGIERGKERK